MIGSKRERITRVVVPAGKKDREALNEEEYRAEVIRLLKEILEKLDNIWNKLERIHQEMPLP